MPSFEQIFDRYEPLHLFIIACHPRVCTRAVERWSRLDSAHLAHEVTVEDPKFYTKPFTFSRVFTAMAPGQELYEMACDENNIDRDGGHLGYGPLDLKAYPLEPKVPKK